MQPEIKIPTVAELGEESLPYDLLPLASINRRPYIRLPGMDPEWVGLQAMDLCSSRTLVRLIQDHAAAAGAGSPLPIRPGCRSGSIPCWKRRPTTRRGGLPSKWRTCTGAGWDICWLRSCSPKAASLCRWGLGGGVPEALEKRRCCEVCLGGGLASGRLGARIAAAAAQVLEICGLGDRRVTAAAHPSFLPLIGAARGVGAGAWQAAAVADFGGTRAKRGVAYYTSHGALQRLRILPPVTIAGLTSQGKTAELAEEMIAIMAETIRQAGPGTTLAPQVICSVAAYVRDGQPMLVSGRNMGIYAWLHQLTPGTPAVTPAGAARPAARPGGHSAGSRNGSARPAARASALKWRTTATPRLARWPGTPAGTQGRASTSRGGDDGHRVGRGVRAARRRPPPARRRLFCGRKPLKGCRGVGGIISQLPRGLKRLDAVSEEIKLAPGAAQAEEAVESFQTGEIITVAAAHGAHDTYFSFLPTILPLLIENSGLNTTQAGLLSACSQIPNLMQPLIGHLADRKNLKLLVILAPTLSGILITLVGIAPLWNGRAAAPAGGFQHGRFPLHRPGHGGSQRPGQGGARDGFLHGGRRVWASASARWWWWRRSALLTLNGLPWLMTLGMLASVILYFRLHNTSTVRQRRARPACPLRQALLQMRGLMLPIMAILFITGFSDANIVNYLPTFMSREGTSFALAGASLSVVQLGGTIGVFLMGLYTDRLGQRNIALMGTLLSTAFPQASCSPTGLLQMVMLARHRPDPLRQPGLPGHGADPFHQQPLAGQRRLHVRRLCAALRRGGDCGPAGRPLWHAPGLHRQRRWLPCWRCRSSFGCCRRNKRRLRKGTHGMKTTNVTFFFFLQRHSCVLLSA